MTENPPEVTILLLGDSNCGKSTFLSRVSQGNPNPTTENVNLNTNSNSHPSKTLIPLLHDENQPFIFDITFKRLPYRFEFYDTASPDNWKLLTPNVIILCYDISSRLSLINAQRQWSPLIPHTFPSAVAGKLPILLLGLKRDLRSETDPNGIIYPQEAYRIAQELRCDKYMECSAYTLELVQEVIEDVCRTAVATVADCGDGLSEGGCELM